MNFKWFFVLLAIGFLGLLNEGCYYDVAEEIYPDTACDTIGITYNEDILPLVTNNCYVCHDQSNNFGGITLEGYDNLKKNVDNGKFLGAIKHEDGFSAMPQGQPKLQDCNIEKIESWINAGAPNN